MRRPAGRRAGREADRRIARGRELAAELPRLGDGEVHARAADLDRAGIDLVDLVAAGDAADAAAALDAVAALAAAVGDRRDRSLATAGNPAVYAARRLAAVLFGLRDGLAERLAAATGPPLDDRPAHPRLRAILGTTRRDADRPIVVHVATGRALTSIPWWRTLWIVELDPTCPRRPLTDHSSDQDDLDREHAAVLQEHADRYLERHGRDFHVVLLREDELARYDIGERVLGPLSADEALALVAGCRWEPAGEVPPEVRAAAEAVLPYRIPTLIERWRSRLRTES